MGRDPPPDIAMKAVRSTEAGAAIVDLDEAPGSGELLAMKSASSCASDFSYIRFGSPFILGHELAGIREDEFDWWPLFHREARLIPSLGYCAHEGGREMEDAAAMLADDPEITRTLITHRYPIEDAVEAFRVAADKKSGAIRVILEPN